MAAISDTVAIDDTASQVTISRWGGMPRGWGNRREKEEAHGELPLLDKTDEDELLRAVAVGDAPEGPIIRRSFGFMESRLLIKS